MKKWFDKAMEWLAQALFRISPFVYGVLAPFALLIALTSLSKNLLYLISVKVALAWNANGNYIGILVGFVAYLVLFMLQVIPRVRHNLKWFMKFTHELTHTLVAILFGAKIREFVVKDRFCYVNYDVRLGYIPITLSPYCIPIYTFMLFPFRFVGDSHYMIIFDTLIAFTYAFHVHSFIKQTRFKRDDIKNCGPVLSTLFITFVHSVVISLILAIPCGGVWNAVYRVFYEYPKAILTAPAVWFTDVMNYMR